MKAYNQLKDLAQRINARSATLALVPVVALQSRLAHAELPEMELPTEAIGGGSVSEGDWLGAMGGYFKAGITIFGLIAVALGFLYAVMGALGKWRAYSTGRAEMADLQEYFIMAAVFGIFLVIIASYAMKTLA